MKHAWMTGNLRGLLIVATLAGLLGIGCDAPSPRPEAGHEDHGEEYGNHYGESGDEGGEAREDGHAHGESHTQEDGGHEEGGPESEKVDGAHGAHDEHAGGEEAAHADEVTLTAAAIRAYGLRVEVAGTSSPKGGINVPGRVAFNAEAMAHVGTPVEGRVTELAVKLGTEVEKGHLLLTIDSPALGEAQSEMLEKSTAVEVARTSRDVTRATYERSRTLLEGKGLSLGEFQRREGEFRIAEGGLLAAQASATAAENRLHLYGMSEAQVQRVLESGEVDPRFEVRAPIAGRVVQREATLGEIVGPDREALLVLADMRTLWILADVPEDRIAQIFPGTEARAAIAALGGRELEGKVTHIAAEIEASTRTASVRIEIADAPVGLQPGMFGQIMIATGSGEGGMSPGGTSVPEAAVQTVEGGPAVFVPVPGEEHTFAKRSVRLGAREGAYFPVLSGLKPGESFVAEGSFILKAELGKSSAAHEH